MDNQKTEFKSWAIIQIMGHDQVAGQCEVVYYGNNSMVRVDIPEVPRTDSSPMIPAWTRIISFGAIFDICPVDEDTARSKASVVRAAPIKSFDMRPILADHLNKKLQKGELLLPEVVEEESDESDLAF